MAKNTLTFIQEIMKEIGEYTGDTNLQAVYLTWLQDGVDKIFNFANWGDFMFNSETISTVASQAEYSLQASAREVVSMRITSIDQPIRHYTKAELDRIGLDLEDTGKPIYYYETGYDVTTSRYKIAFYPVPDAIYSIAVTEERQSIALSTSDNIPLPQEFLGALRNYIRAEAYKNEKDLDNANSEIQSFRIALNDLKRKVGNKMGDEPRLAISDVPSNSNGKWQSADPNRFSNKWD